MNVVLSTWAVPRSYKEDNWGNQVSSVWKSVKKRVSDSQLKTVGKELEANRHWGKGDLRAEAEESPLLEAVTRERLAKTQQAGKGLAGAVVICELWR
jgi:hypothetical protein